MIMKAINIISVLFFTISVNAQTTLKKMNMKEELATIGGGCFWCTEAVFEEIEGVNDVISGYSGGTVINPSYRACRSGSDQF